MEGREECGDGDIDGAGDAAGVEGSVVGVAGRGMF